MAAPDPKPSRCIGAGPGLVEYIFGQGLYTVEEVFDAVSDDPPPGMTRLDEKITHAFVEAYLQGYGQCLLDMAEALRDADDNDNIGPLHRLLDLAENDVEVEGDEGLEP